MHVSGEIPEHYGQFLKSFYQTMQNSINYINIAIENAQLNVFLSFANSPKLSSDLFAILTQDHHQRS